MDFASPVEALIPGVRGRVLGVLARTETPLTMRSVAEISGVSVNRAATVLNELIDLGMVERRDAGRAALVRLDRQNEAARIVLRLQDLRGAVVDRLRRGADDIEPAPLSLVLFGSFARGEARSESDLDVVAVAPSDVDEEQWHASLGRWSDDAARTAGNPISLVTLEHDELRTLMRRRDGTWRKASEEGIVLAGVPLDAVLPS